MPFVARGSSQGSGPQTLRRVLAGVGLLLVVVVFGFLVAGKLRARNWVKGLPGRLGVGITQDSNSFTYDQFFEGEEDLYDTCGEGGAAYGRQSVAARCGHYDVWPDGTAFGQDSRSGFYL